MKPSGRAVSLLPVQLVFRAGVICCWFSTWTPVTTAQSLSAPAAETTTSPESPASTVQAPSIEKHIRHLAGSELRGRSGDESLATAAYLRRHFMDSGLQPLFGDSYFQEIPGRQSTDNSAVTAVAGRNVGAWIRGSDPVLRDRYVIVSAHFDHLGTRDGRMYPGADDNASGVSMLLEVSRLMALSQHKPKRSVVFVGFDLEERMLWGSRWFAAHPPWPLEQISLFMTADMIGRSLGNLPLPTVFVLGSEHAPQLRGVLDAVAVPDGLEIARLGIDLIGTRSDYGPFRDQQVPFLFFSTGEHPDYHSPRDVPDLIEFDKTARIANLILRITLQVADGTEEPVWTSDPDTGLDEAKSLNRLVEIMLDEQTEREFTDLQRMLITHVQSKTGAILADGHMGKADRSWLTKMAQLLLLSVF